ncbi:MAG TPA: Uma2 family endonuclease [Gemmataceae bacterium]|jgi:Uma2 family endonuclease|nr:Uma2 family endonuclease [Gemmataceae bacterium]
MVVPNPPPATLDDLYRVEGKAELIAGRIVRDMAAGRLPNRVAKRIVFSLDTYATQTGVGEAFTDNIGYAIRPPLANGRESFSPDASYHAGPFPTNQWKFIEAAPTFAVDVRSEGDYGPTAEAQMADKRDDYFLAGTAIVWDVDPDAETVTVYRTTDPDTPTIYHRGEVAEAEPAVPGWRVPIDSIFD